MKIVIYDTQHYEMVNVLFNIFDNEENELLFLVDRKVQEKLFNHKFSSQRVLKHRFLVKEDYKPAEFYQECERVSISFSPDLIIMNTIDKDYKFTWNYLKKVNKPFLVTLHNITTWLDAPFTLNWKALTNYYYRKKTIRKSALIAVQEELFIDYIKTKGLYSKTVIAIPHTLKESEPVHSENDKIRISIPGAIDGWRRDYDFAFEVIESINRKSDKFQFVFLGPVYGPIGETYMRKIRSLQSEGLEIEHYYDENSNTIFDSQMQSSDLVFLPLRVHTKYEGINEIYGTTKVTGVIYDMMRFAKPGVVTGEMVIPPTMKTSLLPYESANQLVEFLLDLASDNTKLLDLKSKAIENSDYYTSQGIQSRILPVIRKEMEKLRIK